MDPGFYWIDYLIFKRKLRKLNPTGNWKIEYEPYISRYGTIKPTLFIEHKGLVFKKWVSENDITELTHHF